MPLKILALLAVFAALAGCTDADWENAMSYLPQERGAAAADQAVSPVQTASTPASSAAQPAAPASDVTPRDEGLPSHPALTQPTDSDADVGKQRAVAPSATTVNEHCRAVARQRAADSGYMGMDEDAQKEEYDGTYASCVAWDAMHGG
jgi:hypothetical protein